VDEALWTLDELAQRARQALAADGVRSPNGRVRELGDDGRAIRWYGTKGLVDRPTIGPGHAARYGPRHLLQLVAVKRLQARGMSLAEIQQELAGATDAVLRGIAGIPVPGAEDEAIPPPAPKAAKAAVPRSAAAPAGRFWTARAAAGPVADLAPAATAAAAAAAADGDTVDAAAVRYLVVLSDSDAVTLALPALPDAADLAAIRAAAAPLLALLTDRGLTTPHRNRNRNRNEGD